MQPTRRQVLLAGVALTAASTTACTTRSRPERTEPSPDERLRADAVAREQALLAAYTAALHEHPALTPLLAPLLGDHAAHLSALDAGPSAGPTGAPAARRSRRAVVRDLLAREKQAAVAHAAAAERAELSASCGRTLAPLLASLAASEAAHAVVLA